MAVGAGNPPGAPGIPGWAVPPANCGMVTFGSGNPPGGVLLQAGAASRMAAVSAFRVIAI